MAQIEQRITNPLDIENPPSGFYGIYFYDNKVWGRNNAGTDFLIGPGAGGGGGLDPGSTPGSVLYWDGAEWTENTNLIINGSVIEAQNQIRIGNSTGSDAAGMIRYNGDFEGYNGSAWVSLTAGGGLGPGTTTGSVLTWNGNWVENTDLLVNGGIVEAQNQLQVGDSTGTPVSGQIRFRSTYNDLEGYDGTQWVSLTPAATTISTYSSGPVTLTDSDYLALFDVSAASINVNLPATPRTGRAYTIKDNGNAGSNMIIINGNGNDIEGATSITISNAYDSVNLVYSGSEWFIGNTPSFSTASESSAGTVELATQAEVDAGTDTTRVITPEKLAQNRINEKITRRYDSGEINLAASTQFFVTHNLGVQYPNVIISRNNEEIDLVIDFVNVNTIGITSNSTLTSPGVFVTIIA